MHVETLRHFEAQFAAAGLKESSLTPSYGLAEFTLAAALPAAGAPLRVDVVDREEFQTKGRAIRTKAGDKQPAIEWPSVGQVISGHEIRIVGPEGEELAERMEGEIELRGPSMMSGYFGEEMLSAQAVRQRWLRTGDRGYLAEGDLFVTGRSKEIICVRGRNIYPDDVEAAAERVPGVRRGRCAAFGTMNATDGTEDLVVLCEVAPLARNRKTNLAIRESVSAQVGVRPRAIVFAPLNTIPRTSSGKVQRRALRASYEAAELATG